MAVHMRPKIVPYNPKFHGGSHEADIVP